MDAHQVFRQGKWWYQQPDETWVVWDQATRQWNAAPGPPPPERPHKPYRNFRTQRLWVISMLGIVVLVDAVAVLFDLREHSLLGQIAERAGVTAAEAEASDPRQEAMGVLQISVHIATWITFIAWFHRAYSNVIALGPERTRYRAGWAIAGWLIPILHFFRPKQITNDIWWATSSPPMSERISPLLQWWWGLWLIAQQLSGQAEVEYLNAETIDELRISVVFYVAADATSTVAGILAILVVIRLSERVHAKAIESGLDAGPL